jgi:hypothetical protein
MNATGMNQHDFRFFEATRVVPSDATATWERLNQEAIAAHLAFVNAARGAAVAKHRGEHRRAWALTQLARKQHSRWVKASQHVTTLEV